MGKADHRIKFIKLGAGKTKTLWNTFTRQFPIAEYSVACKIFLFCDRQAPGLFFISLKTFFISCVHGNLMILTTRRYYLLAEALYTHNHTKKIRVLSTCWWRWISSHDISHSEVNLLLRCNVIFIDSCSVKVRRFCFAASDRSTSRAYFVIISTKRGCGGPFYFPTVIEPSFPLGIRIIMHTL